MRFSASDKRSSSPNPLPYKSQESSSVTSLMSNLIKTGLIRESDKEHNLDNRLGSRQSNSGYPTQDPRYSERQLGQQGSDFWDRRSPEAERYTERKSSAGSSLEGHTQPGMPNYYRQEHSVTTRYPYESDRKQVN